MVVFVQLNGRGADPVIVSPCYLLPKSVELSRMSCKALVLVSSDDSVPSQAV